MEDRRGRGGNGRVIAGGGIGVVILVAYLLLGGDPQLVMDLAQQQRVPTAQVQPDAESDELAQFVSVVLADTEDVWTRQFSARGMSYRAPRLVLFSGQVDSACGSASAAMGPFYCPADETVYIDLTFYRELRDRFGAPGDFAQAYVIAHEVGHHVQKLLGITEKVHAARGQVSEAEYNNLSVRLELQADFLAGVWAHDAQQISDVLELGDIEEALGAASAIGDDTLQRQTRGRVVPDTFTHGSSEQRMRWFQLGYETGDLERGDTFNTDAL